jgi:hypothetical protein
LIKNSAVIFGLIIIILFGILIYNQISFDSKVESEVNSLIQKTESFEDQIISDESLKKLPLPVKKYLKYTGVLNKKPVKFARLKQTGEIRPDGEKWIRFNAEQYMSSNGFIWYAKIEPFNMISAMDKFSNRKGGMLIKFFSSYTIADAKGKEIDISSLLRLISEMAIIPSAFVKENILWKKINSHSAGISVNDGDLQVSGVFIFNDIGEIISFTTDERYMSKNGINVKEKWTVIFSDYKEFAGLKVPTKAEAVWNLIAGDMPYVKVDITEIEYDIFKIYK